MAASAELRVLTRSPLETEALAEDLGRLLSGGEVIALAGDLGSGKTAFTRGLARGLESADRVTSPTYVLEQVYRGRLVIHHYDAYRLEGEEELRGLGFEEHLGTSGVLIVEWAERVEGVLPPERLLVEIDFADAPGASGRRLRFSGTSTRWREVLERLGSPGGRRSSPLERGGRS